jgi:ABC-type branched-subunit amino acid transport system ATPase component
MKGKKERISDSFILPLLEVENLISGYGKLAIIQGVSLTIEPGDFVALVGPNGSGKSTLIKSIVGLATIFEGEVKFDGTGIKNKKPEQIAALRLGYVPQVSNVFTDLTVRENLEMGSTIVKSSLQKKKLLDQVELLFPILRSRAHQRAGYLSGGERQMLAVGRALMAEPKLLILDEPTAALAPKLADQLFVKLSEIRSQLGVTIVLVEQNARRALSLSNRGVVLIQGKKAFEGTPEQILKDTEVIRLFLGELTV